MYKERLLVKLVSLGCDKFLGEGLSFMCKNWLIFSLIVKLRIVGGVIFKRKSTEGGGVVIFEGVLKFFWKKHKF